MAVNLDSPSQLQTVKGIRLASIAAGVRYQGRDDLALLELARSSQVAVVFTRNAFCAAPVIVAKRHLNHASPRYLLINSGNANAGLGEAGEQDALACCQKLAALCHCRVEEVIPFSTGVIGERLPADKITSVLSRLTANLSADGWLQAARAIMTTDTLPKGVSRTLQINDNGITVTGIAKGAGMIRPNMATMLSFVAIDAEISRELLSKILRRATGASFNAITVDGDTSTNDACVLVATGCSGVEIRADDSPIYWDVYRAIKEVMTHLAQAIVRDAEGVTKFITIWVKGALSDQEAHEVAYTVAHSPLVKTAFFAQDPNLGRLVAAVGRARLDQLNINDVDMALDEVSIFSKGAVDCGYTEEAGQRVMAKPEITVSIDLHRGRYEAKIWTTDLSHEYVRINAEYRT
jgi:glutamate N-acetyltransferase/amino-acid N-acetyltransferase